MEKADLLKPADLVKVTILGPDNTTLYEATASGFHTLEEAVRDNVAKANLNISPEDCVFIVTNITTDVNHKYRLNAHGNLKLII